MAPLVFRILGFPVLYPIFLVHQPSLLLSPATFDGEPQNCSLYRKTKTAQSIALVKKLMSTHSAASCYRCVLSFTPLHSCLLKYFLMSGSLWEGPLLLHQTADADYYDGSEWQKTQTPGGADDHGRTLEHDRTLLESLQCPTNH